MSSTSILPLLAFLLLHIDLTLFVFSPWLRSRFRKVTAAVLVISISVLPVLSFLPAVQLPLVLYSRAIFGDLSIVTLVLFCAHLVNHFFLVKNNSGTTPDEKVKGSSVRCFEKEIRYLCAAIIPVAVILYPTALGWTYFDLYAQGYYPTLLSGLIICWWSYCVWNKQFFLAVSLGFSLVAWAFDVLDSNNLWDYLIDPVLVVYAISVVVWNWRDYVKSLASITKFSRV